MQGKLGNDVLVDTSAWFALLDKGDKFHTDAINFVEQNTYSLVTSDLVLSEALNLISRRLGMKAVKEFGKQIFGSSGIKLVKITRDMMNKAWKIYEGLGSKDLSFVDCTTAIYASQRNLPVFAFDSDFKKLMVKVLPQ